MRVTLNAKTTRETLARESKESLVETLAAAQPTQDRSVLKRMSKFNLLAALMVQVEKLAREEEAQAAAAEVARQATLAAEQAEGKVRAALQNLLHSASQLVDVAKQTIGEFQAEVAKGPWAIQSAITWRTEKVLAAIAVLRHFEALQNYLAKRIERQDETAAQIGANLQEQADETLRRCLDDGYRHNSTNALDNIQHLCEFAATQTAAKFYRQAAQAWAKAIQSGDGFELGYIRAY